MSKATKRNPIPAPEELLSQYTPLVYHIISPYLSNPEDRKECANEIFFEFYESLDRFDPEKGSYVTWLAAIARNKAVSFYRKNRNIEKMTAPDAGLFGADYAAYAASGAYGVSGAYAASDPYAAADSGIEDSIVSKADLETALSKLDPDELELIRKKYYDGMTIKEIAASMNLPYETVKKRHQRSLSKLRLFLLVLALLGILAGCGYLVMRHLGIIPGFGVSTEEDMVLYRMEESVSVEIPDSGLTAKFTSAVYQGAQLQLNFLLYKEDGSPYEADVKEYTENGIHHNESSSFEAYLLLEDQTLPAWTLSSPVSSGTESIFSVNQPTFQYPEVDKVFDSQSEVTLPFRIDLTREHSWYPEDWNTPRTEENSGETVEIYASFSANLTLKRIDEETLQQYPSEYTEEQGGVAAIPRIENDELIVSLYPIHGEHGNVLSEITEYHAFYRTKPITLTDENGTVYTGKRLNAAESSAVFYSEWNFGPVEPGTCTLHIPYLLKCYPFPKQLQFPIDIVDCEPPKKTWKFDGGSFRITGITPTTWDEVEAGNYPKELVGDYFYNRDHTDENFLNPFTDADLLWKIDIETSLDFPDETVEDIYFSATRDKKHGMEFDSNFVLMRTIDYPQNGKLSYLLIWVGGSIYRDSPPYNDMYLELSGYEMNYMNLFSTGSGPTACWNREFDLEIPVDGPIP